MERVGIRWALPTVSLGNTERDPPCPGLAGPLVFSGSLAGAGTSTTRIPSNKHIPGWRLQPRGVCPAAMGLSSGPVRRRGAWLSLVTSSWDTVSVCVLKPSSCWAARAPGCSQDPGAPVRVCAGAQVPREQGIAQQIKTPLGGERPQMKKCYILFYV